MADKVIIGSKSPKLKARIQRSISPKTQTISLEGLTASLVEDVTKTSKITEKNSVAQSRPFVSQDLFSPKTSAASKTKQLKQVNLVSPTSKPSDEYKLSVKSPKVPKLNIEGLAAHKTPTQNRIISPSPTMSKQSTPRKMPINARKISSSGQPTPRDNRTDHQENLRLQHSQTEMKAILMTSPLRHKIQSQIISKQHPKKTQSVMSSRIKSSAESLKSVRMNLNEHLLSAENTSKPASCPKCGSALPGSGVKGNIQANKQVDEEEKREYEKIKAMYKLLEQEMSRIQEKTKTLIQEASLLLAQKNKEIAHLLNYNSSGNLGTFNRSNSQDVTYESILKDSKLKEQEFHEFAHVLKEQLANGHFANEEEPSIKSLISHMNCSSNGESQKHKATAKEQGKDKEMQLNGELHGQIEQLQRELKEQKEMYEQVSKDIADMYKKEKHRNERLEDEVKALKREIASLSSLANSEIVSNDSDVSDSVVSDYEEKLKSFQDELFIRLRNAASLIDAVRLFRIQLQEQKKAAEEQLYTTK